MSIQILTGDCRDPNGRFKKGVHAYRSPKPHWERDWLHREYVTKQRSSGEIAAEIGCTESNVLFWLEKHDIQRRSISESRSVKRWGATGAANPMYGRVGAMNPRYVDGSSPERQRLYARHDWKQFLRQIYRRDGFCCVRCRAPKSGPKSLHAHHIKPWAGNPDLRFNENNVVTLCRRCHDWVHSNRNSAREYLA